MEYGSTLNGEYISLESARKIRAIDSLSRDLNITYDKLEKEVKLLIKKNKELQEENNKLKKERRELQLLVLEGIKRK